MERYKNVLFVAVLIMGLVALYIGWQVSSTHSTTMGLVGVALGISAMAIKITLAKKGHKNIMATIGSYAGTIAFIMCLIQVLL